MLFITLVLSFALVALIVMALKKNQQRRLDDLAERDHSLPPLDIAPEPPATLPTLEPVASALRSEATAEQAGDWREQCKELRQAHLFEQALVCADQAWPLFQSYEQTALTLRAAIKQAQQDASPEFDKWLTTLYRTAAEASFLYDKVAGEPELRWQSIARTYSRQELRRIELPWIDIGADKLRLLTKTDRKLMIQAWGDPRQHISAKIYKKQPLEP